MFLPRGNRIQNTNADKKPQELSTWLYFGWYLRWWLTQNVTEKIPGLLWRWSQRKRSIFAEAEKQIARVGRDLTAGTDQNLLSTNPWFDPPTATFLLDGCLLDSLVIFHVLTNTEVPEIQDVEGPKSIAPPSTGQPARPKWTIFRLETPQGSQLRGTVAIFEFSPTSRDRGDLSSKIDSIRGSENRPKF